MEIPEEADEALCWKEAMQRTINTLLSRAGVHDMRKTDLPALLRGLATLCRLSLRDLALPRGFLLY